MAKIDFGGIVEEVITSEEFTLEKARQVLKNEVVAVVGYGIQGRGQSLNMRDNGVNVLVGEGPYAWDQAVADGFVPGETLFSPEEAAKRGTIIQYLLSDAGQKEMWPVMKNCLQPGTALYFPTGSPLFIKSRPG
jgi:ketol-acid reductoisomerase